MAVPYSFITRWETSASINDVWLVIQDSLSWPQWWPYFITVSEVKHGNEYGVGSVRRYTLKSPAAYTLTFDLELTRIVEHSLLSGKASGELEGTGIWQFATQGGKTIIECHWNVHTNKAWMNMFAFILRPMFEYNHKLVMLQGAESLAVRLGKEVIVVN